MRPLRLVSLNDVTKHNRVPGSKLLASHHRGVRGTRIVSQLMALAIVAGCACIAPSLCHAGTGGTEFTATYQEIVGWLQGDLGRLIASSLLLVGLVMGVVRQSIMAAVPAIACGLVATVAPTIIGAVVTAVI